MDDIVVARALHVACVVLWIGGVGFVTTVLLPAVRRLKDPEGRLALFETIERRFAWQARITTFITGLTGFYLVVQLDLWRSFATLEFWWLDAMLLVWLAFSAMLFVAEPFFLERWFRNRARAKPEETFRLIIGLHRALLILSLITVLGAVIGSHGGM